MVLSQNVLMVLNQNVLILNITNGFSNGTNGFISTGPAQDRLVSAALSQ